LTADLAVVVLGADLLAFTVTFDVAILGVGLCCCRAAFLGADTFGLTFPGFAFPGFFTAFVGFFEGIYRLRLFTKERAIIPTPIGLYRPLRNIF
jgi:hypothetical protein